MTATDLFARLRAGDTLFAMTDPESGAAPPSFHLQSGRLGLDANSEPVPFGAAAGLIGFGLVRGERLTAGVIRYETTEGCGE